MSAAPVLITSMLDMFNATGAALSGPAAQVLTLPVLDCILVC